MSHPGVHVSDLSTDDFAPDPEVGGMTHTLRAEGGVEAGIWTMPSDATPGPIAFTLEENETILVLEGEARIEIGGGPTIELRPGVMVSLAEGLETTWHVTPGFKEFFVLG